MMSMVMTQATGVPNGNHGLFHRYNSVFYNDKSLLFYLVCTTFCRFGIEAITLEAYEKKGRGIYISVLQVGR